MDTIKEPELWVLDVINDPEKLVIRYINFVKQGIDINKDDGVLEYYEKLNSIKGALALHELKDKLTSYFWLIEEKLDSIEKKEYEYAAVLRDVQKDLTGILVGKNETLGLVQKFLMKKKEKENVELEFEKYLLRAVKENGKIRELDFMELSILTAIVPIKYLESVGMVQEFSGYYNSLK